jgi:hypothetical protein
MSIKGQDEQGIATAPLHLLNREVGHRQYEYGAYLDVGAIIRYYFIEVVFCFLKFSEEGKHPMSFFRYFINREWRKYF